MADNQDIPFQKNPEAIFPEVFEKLPFWIKKSDFMGFIRQQEKRLAIRLLTWQYQRMNLPVPVFSELERQAGKLVDDAHRIARERGHNLVGIMKDLVKDLIKG